MGGNLQNGGLVLKQGEMLLVTDIKNYSGMRLLGETNVVTDALCWFMNLRDDRLYYSDQKRGHALYRMRFGEWKPELIVDQPCYGLILHEDLLYYINEQDRCIYCCTTDGDHVMKLIDERVTSFCIHAGRIYYATLRAVIAAELSGKHKETLIERQASMLVPIGGQLALLDAGNHNTLHLISLHNEKTLAVEHVRSTSLNTDGHYLYCANHLNNNSIYRVDPNRGTNIRIYSEPADYLHIWGEDLIFSHQRDWFRLSLAGGEAIRLGDEMR